MERYACAAQSIVSPVTLTTSDERLLLWVI
jgi:hypothetical protein